MLQGGFTNTIPGGFFLQKDIDRGGWYTKKNVVQIVLMPDRGRNTSSLGLVKSG
jgi:hypothetical protein